MALGRPIQMEKSRCSEDNTSTNSAFAQSSLPKDFHLLTPVSVLPFASLSIFKVFAQKPKAEQKAAGRMPRAGAASLLCGHKLHPALKQPQSPGQGAEIPQAALVAKGKGSFLSSWFLLQLERCCPFKQLGYLQEKSAPRASPAGHPEGSGCSSHPSIRPFIPSSPAPSNGKRSEPPNSVKSPTRWLES